MRSTGGGDGHFAQLDMLEPRRLLAAYAVVDLGTLGGTSAKAYAINNAGQVVGEAKNGSGATRAFLYSGGKMTALPTLGGSSSIAYGINDSGKIVGESTLGDGKARAFVYAAGAMNNLGTLSGGNESRAFAINASGQAAGFSTIAGGAYRAFRYSGGVMTNLGSIAGGTNAFGYGINRDGTVVGNARTSVGDRGFRAAVGASVSNLGTLAGGNKSHVYGINARNWAVGESTTSNGQTHAVMHRDGAMRDLGVLGGGNYSHAYGLNLNGDVVGQAKNSSGALRAVIAPMSGSTSGSMRDLNSMIPSGTGWTLLAAHAISDDAKIVGYGSKGGQTRAFLLLPTPNGSISGQVFHDADGNGSRGLSEAVLSSWRVFLDADKDGVFDAGEASATTDANGHWAIKNLPAGTFSVRVVIKSGWKPTAPAGGSFSISVSTGGVVTGRNFGLASG